MSDRTIVGPLTYKEAVRFDRRLTEMIGDLDHLRYFIGTASIDGRTARTAVAVLEPLLADRAFDLDRFLCDEMDKRFAALAETAS